MNILITGGCGFIGTNLISRLHQKTGISITVLDNLSGGALDHIKEFDFSFIEGDIIDRDTVEQAVKGQDAVIHLAADTRVMDSIENPAFNFTNNVTGSLNILEAMRQQGVKKFVCASTGGAIIGNAKPPVHENMLPKPMSPYGASKLCLEAYCHAYQQSFDMDCTALRFSNVYGPYSFHKGSVVAAFIRNIINEKPLVIYGDGSQTRDFVYAADLVDGILAALFQPCPEVSYQLGTGVPTSVNEVTAILEKVVGKSNKINIQYKDFRQGEVRHNYCNVSRAKQSLGYAPQMTLEEGIERTWNWFLSKK